MERGHRFEKRRRFVIKGLSQLFRLDEFESVRNLSRVVDLSICGFLVTIENIVLDRVVEKKGFLHHEAHLTS